MFPLVFWLAVWTACYFAIHQDLLLAAPWDVAKRFTFVTTAPFWRSVGMSLMRTAAAYGIGVALACVLALLCHACPLADEVIRPALAVVRATPVASFIILALVWLDSRSLPLFISALMVFPPVYLNVLAGIAAADGKLLEMARVFRVPLGRRLAGIYLPAVLPYFRSAVSLALGLCWKAGAAAEVIGLPSGPIGERLYTAKVYFQTPDLFAWTAVIVAVSVLFEKLFLALVDALAGKAVL